MSNLLYTTIPSTVQAAAAPLDRVKSAGLAYMAALEEYCAAKGTKPIWYSLADDFDFGFVCRIEAADA
ncbi:hypothetical protein NKH74_10640 [Mesorhizobium sp. M0933]|uniref:hypothetical protein n=1 Tax=Mesorhizobium sp. M0933 TaxID=2957030 RepID=UPI003334AF6A